MRVQEIITSGNKKRYLLVDQNGEFVKPVVKFLKYKDNTGSARNTLRSYSYALKLFFEFLEQKKADYRDIGIDDMAEFIRWLQNPYRDVKVTSISPIDTKKRKARTINIYLDKVYAFYDYLMRHEDHALDLSDRLKRQILASRSNFKGFLHHTLNNKTKSYKILRLKEPKEKLKVMTAEQVQILVYACQNIRDKFLLALLYETGMRIGEALSLHLSDVLPAAKKVTICDRGELINEAEIKTVCSPRTLDISSELANLYRAYILDSHTDEVDTNFVFIKLMGKQKGFPLDYQAVQALFTRLKFKTGIDATPHMLRHTNITELWKTGEMRPETLQKRAGHAHVQTTIQMYVHPSDEDIRKDWENAMEQKQLWEKKNDD
ncbi:tyrosine-type recombinase/integrase [Aquibacillus salsiterrae]|uniref:Site-specific integrase n=1 Tax=Aquibacillus salsiterrae TaxID=2950439 RepID=A0A9X3WF71_9BACI|nr:tyrosine-type recombinase/integrase [Aquibacillus salsiterrae]MDC3416222.1 site-specific integrase [Aquibacillus salsiterrae]MDC3416314.1 site-specific integrase [Aquibacillus salsiterrae]